MERVLLAGDVLRGESSADRDHVVPRLIIAAADEAEVLSNGPVSAH